MEPFLQRFHAVICMVEPSGTCSLNFLIQEVHLIDYHGGDFYGRELYVAILGYVRSEENYPSVGRPREL